MQVQKSPRPNWAAGLLRMDPKTSTQSGVVNITKLLHRHSFCARRGLLLGKAMNIPAPQ